MKGKSELGCAGPCVAYLSPLLSIHSTTSFSASVSVSLNVSLILSKYLSYSLFSPLLFSLLPSLVLSLSGSLSLSLSLFLSLYLFQIYRYKLLVAGEASLPRFGIHTNTETKTDTNSDYSWLHYRPVSIRGEQDNFQISIVSFSCLVPSSWSCTIISI